jgi:rhamnose transport system ATP-binding protein
VNTLLRATGLSKSIAGVHALQDVSFVIDARDADEGTLEVNGCVVERNSPVISWKLGIAAIYRQPALFPDLTVAENIALGLEPRGAWQPIPWGERRRRARDLLAPGRLPCIECARC